MSTDASDLADGLPCVAARVLERVADASSPSTPSIDPRLLTRLFECSRRLQRSARDLADRLPEEDEATTLDLAAQRFVRELMALVREFVACLRKIDLAAIEIFNPDLRIGITGALSADATALALIQEVTESPYNRARFQRDETLENFLESLHRSSYWLESSAFDGELAASTDSPEHPIAAPLVAALRALAVSLRDVGDELASFVKDNWSPVEFARIQLPPTPTTQITAATGAQVIIGDNNRAEIYDSIFVADNFRAPSDDPRVGRDVLVALGELAELVRADGGTGVAKLFCSFEEALSGEEPEPSRVKKLWQGLTAALGPVSQLADIGAKLSGVM